MNTTSSNLPICVHCGTPRPADETLCPTCGEPWIDTTIPAAPKSAATPPPIVPGTADDPEENVSDGDGSSALPIVAAGAVAGAAAASQRDGENSDDNDDEDSGDGESTDGTGEAEESDEDGMSAAPVAAATVAGAAAASRRDGENSDEDPGDGVSAEDPDDSAGSEEPDTAEATDVVTEETPVAVPPPPLGPDDTGEFAFDAWVLPPEIEDEPRRTAWLVPAGIGVAVLAALTFLVFGGSNSPSATTVAALSTTTIQVTTSSPSSTTAAQATTTTAIDFPQPEDWPARGEPIDTVELTLTQSAIGPIDVGTPIEDVAGVLTATFGQASASGIEGVCPPDESYWLQFGQLTAIFDGFESGSVFVSYRYDEAQGDDPDLGLETLSGIAIGDTVEDLINTYTQFTISFEIIDSKDYFRLSNGGELLLWGPVSSVDPAGLIEGIYAPTACDTTT